MATTLGHHVPHAAVIWVDGWHALVARNEQGRPRITEVDREADPMHDYFVRVAHEADDCDRLMLLGPAGTLGAFEREYESLYRRADRFVDAEAAAGATERDLLERLVLIDPAQRRS